MEERKVKNLLKNRIVIGLICIILSLIICFGLTPMFNNALKSKVSLIRVNTEIHKGDQITEKMFTTVEVGGYNLPGNVVYKAEDVVGKYANTDLYKGDYILESKLSDTPMLKNAYLSKLNGENRAISVSIKSFAAGLSGKLEAGDIVTLIASDVGEKRETLVLPELQYVEIIATTASSGTDNDVRLMWRTERNRNWRLLLPCLQRRSRQGFLQNWNRPENFMQPWYSVGTAHRPKSFWMNSRKS